MKKQLFIISFLFFYNSLIGQNVSSQLSIYFFTEKHDLNNQYKSLIDNHLDSIKKFNFTNVKIIGHTDSVGNLDYNFNLSLKRAYSVLNYLVEKGYNRDSIEVDYLGENSPDFDNNTEGGKQKNRRTDIVFYRVEKSKRYITNVEKNIPKQHESIEITKLPPVIKKDTCDRDTILIFPQGLEVRMGICDYYKKKDYFGVDVVINQEALKSSDLTTYDINGDPLITGGMFFLRNHPTDSCFSKPVVFRVRLDSCNRNIDFGIWDIEKNGRWRENRQLNLRKIKIGKEIYLEFQLKCIRNGIWFNLDGKPCSKKIKFKIGNGLKITELRFVSECPNFAGGKRNISSKSVTFWIPCGCTNENKQSIKVKAVNKKNEQFEMDFQNLSSFSKAFRISIISNCKGLIRITKRCSRKFSKKKFIFGKTTMKKYLLPINLFKKVEEK